MTILEKYQDFCLKRGIPFQLDNKVCPYDDTTLFCPAGMQQFKKQFRDPKVSGQTIANIQSCIRLNDYNEAGDGTHLLYFKMMGLFSFRDMSVKQAIDFWMDFLTTIGLRVDYVTIHPDKIQEWSKWYREYQVEIRTDPECTWGDDLHSAYCTEFYIDNVEIGNIVNPGEDCIDVGFGYERLETFLTGRKLDNKLDIYLEAIETIIRSGYTPGPNKQGYVLRKLLRDFNKLGGTIHEDSIAYQHFTTEIQRQEKICKRYERLKQKHSDKSPEWWYDTHGIDVSLLNQ